MLCGTLARIARLSDVLSRTRRAKRVFVG